MCIVFLDIINVANQACQSKNCNLTHALNLIDEFRSQISSLKDLYTLHKIDHDLDVLDQQYGLKTRPVREKTQSRKFNDFVVDSPIPAASAVDDITKELRRVIVELTDCFQMEMNSRFTFDNNSIWSSMGAHLPNHPDFCDPEYLKPFFEYMCSIPLIKKKLGGLHKDDIESLTSECQVFKNVISRNFESNCDLGEIYVFMKNNYSEAAPVLTSMYKLSLTCGYASARVECLFSAMAYVDDPKRRRRSSKRESALTHLLFEKDLVRQIKFDEFSEEWLKKPRGLFC